MYPEYLFTVACPVVLSDKGESGIGDIADEMIRHGFVSATIQVSNYQATTLTHKWCLYLVPVISRYDYNNFDAQMVPVFANLPSICQMP